MSSFEELSPRQEAALWAVADTLLPRLDVPPSHSSLEQDHDGDGGEPSAEAERRYWNYEVAADPAYRSQVRAAVSDKMAAADRALLLWLLAALASPVGTSLACGTVTFAALADSPPPVRRRLLRGLQNSRLECRRRAFAGLRRLLCGIAFSYTTTATATATATSTTGSGGSTNPFWEAMGFPGPPPWNDDGDDGGGGDDAARVAAAAERQVHVQGAVLREAAATGSEASASSSATATATEQPATRTIDCDVVVVGSGAGGCVAAHTLAAAGWEVVLVERGAHWAPSEISLSEADALDRQYEQHGLLQSADGTILILAGCGVGGGTAVNWGCCLPLPDAVRREWSRDHGLEQFADPEEFEAATRHVLRQMGADRTEAVVHNAVNQKLRDACRALGYPVTTTGQSLRVVPSSPSTITGKKNEKEQLAAGYIGLGDRYGLKHGGGVQGFLEEACEKHGLRIVDQCRVDRVVTTSTETATTETGTAGCRPRAAGVECTVLRGNGSAHHQRLTIRARRSVVVAAGALRTPGLLRQSGLATNAHVGRHLRLHPATGCIGLAPPRSRPLVDSFRGAPMTTVSNQFAALDGDDGDGYGCRIEVPVNTPGLSSVAVTWLTPEIYRQRLRRYRHWMPLLLLQRDSGDGGSVRADRHGSLVVRYRMQRRDRGSLVRALQGGAALLEQMGSEEIATAHIDDFGWKPASETDGRSLGDYQRSIRERGIQNHKLGLFSAHQMGTCRLSTSSRTGAADPNGELWECDNLFVMDASVFPTASGVNPMTTVMSISYMLSRRLALRLQYETENDKDNSDLSDEDRAKAQTLVQQRQEMRLNDFNQAEKRRVIGSLVRRVGTLALPLVTAIIVVKWVKKR